MGTSKVSRRRRSRKLTHGLRWLPGCVWQSLRRRVPRGPVHLIFALADHFEPSIVPEDGFARAPYDEQERRLELWCREYPRLVDAWRDAEGRSFNHTYFYPAEQYDKGLIARLAEHCHTGWGEIEIHLHHGRNAPDTSENARRQLLQFRDALAYDHAALCYMDGSGPPRYAFVHGNFALANSADGLNCGVDDEIQVLAETGCYADLTLPTGAFHAAQIAKINSLYECWTLPRSGATVCWESKTAHSLSRILQACDGCGFGSGPQSPYKAVPTGYSSSYTAIAWIRRRRKPCWASRCDGFSRNWSKAPTPGVRFCILPRHGKW